MRPALARLSRPAIMTTPSYPQVVAPRHTRTMLLKATTLAGGKGPLFAGQDSLPSLPVPPLEQTLTKWLRSTEPHLDSSELAKTKEAVESALRGKDAATFKKLQERLEARAAAPESEGNWLASWWNEAAYMAYRDPVVCFVSYFYLHKDDPSRRTGAKRAAAQLKAMLKFREMLESENLTPEKTKNGPLCSASYPWMFNSVRIPLPECDGAKKYDPKTNNHLVVARNGHFWEFDLIHEGQELSAAEIESQLEKIKQLAVSAKGTPPVGALTGDNRDKWTASREALLAVGNGGGAKNLKALERIESSVIVLALDDAKPVTVEERAWDAWFGDGKNRFYDKQQLIVSNNGKSAYMGEHSTMDGTPTLRMNDFVLSALAANKIDLGTSRRGLPEPKPIEFALDTNVEGKIADSVRAFEELKGKHDLAFLDYQAYGKGAIKKYKCSPDAWAQMAIQLGYFKMFGHPCPTYESAQTRKFKWGRTEVIRSASVESKAFTQAMEADGVSDEKRFELFQAAVKQHLAYASSAANAQGVDRHLFGLKKLLQQGEAVPELYQGVAFGKTSNWQLSTSQISSESFDAWGFGEVTPTGFGCAYAIKENSLTFTLTSLKLDAVKLRTYINEALNDIRALHDRIAAKQSADAKI